MAHSPEEGGFAKIISAYGPKPQERAPDYYYKINPKLFLDALETLCAPPQSTEILEITLFTVLREYFPDRKDLPEMKLLKKELVDKIQDLSLFSPPAVQSRLNDILQNPMNRIINTAKSTKPFLSHVISYPTGKKIPDASRPFTQAYRLKDIREALQKAIITRESHPR
jgi:hypothetical protein